MKKTVIFVLIIVMAICFCSCASDSKPAGYVDFDKLPAGYLTENAIEDGCVVFVGNKLIAGKEVWDAFIADVGKNAACIVRVATKQNEKDSFRFIDLSYADSDFSVKTNDGIDKSYKFLNHYAPADGDDPAIERYSLTNEENITYAEIERRLASSLANDSIDVFFVYLDIE